MTARGSGFVMTLDMTHLMNFRNRPLGSSPTSSPCLAHSAMIIDFVHRFILSPSQNGHCFLVTKRSLFDVE